MKIYWKQHITQPIYFHYCFCLCMNFTTFSHRQRRWGVAGERGFPEWFSMAFHISRLSIWHINQKILIINSVRVLYCQSFSLVVAEQLNDLFFIWNRVLLSSFLNATDTRKNPSKQNRTRRQKANNKSLNYKFLFHSKFLLRRLMSHIVQQHHSRSLMTVWKWC